MRIVTYFDLIYNMNRLYNAQVTVSKTSIPNVLEDYCTFRHNQVDFPTAQPYMLHLKFNTHDLCTVSKLSSRWRLTWPGQRTLGVVVVVVIGNVVKFYDNRELSGNGITFYPELWRVWCGHDTVLDCERCCNASARSFRPFEPVITQLGNQVIPKVSVNYSTCLAADPSSDGYMHIYFRLSHRRYTSFMHPHPHLHPPNPPTNPYTDVIIVRSVSFVCLPSGKLM